MYLILLALGLSIGAVFLVILLIGDKREAKLEVQRRTLQEQINSDADPIMGQAIPSTRPALAPGTSRKMVRAFYWIRGYVAGTAVVAFIIYSSYPRLNFGWVLVMTALAFTALAMIITAFKKSRRSEKR